MYRGSFLNTAYFIYVLDWFSADPHFELVLFSNKVT